MASEDLSKEVEALQIDDEDEEREEWLRKEGVPSFDQPFIQKYLDGRDALVAQEKRQRSDHAFRETLSPMAAEAAAIIAAIRFEEQQTLWNPEAEDDLAAAGITGIFPGMMFTLAKERMESSKLWKIVKKMPKGALLHCHLSAMVDHYWLIDLALKTEGICIKSHEALHTPEALRTAPFSFAYAKPQSYSLGPSIWSSDYKSTELVPIAKTAEAFPEGGKDAFIKWFVSRTTISPEEAISQQLGPNAIWEKFVSCFRILDSLQHYEPIFRAFLREMFKRLNEDGVRWVDIRTTFVDPFYKTGSDEPDPDHENMLACLEDEIESFKSSPEGKGFWGARLIWTGLRALDPRAIVQDMKNCIEMKLLFPELVGGYDFVGQEDIGRPLSDMIPEIFWFKKRCAEAGVDIPFFFHAGETLGDGDSVDENLFDAILLGTRRIGHGFSLYKHPLLCDMVKDKRILIESCPISNEILRLTGSIMSHPLPALLARGVPCCLANDDPSILGQEATGMSHDFWQSLQGFENLGLEGLASLAENSVRWANFEDCPAKQWALELKEGSMGKGIRAQRLKDWAREFEQFCQWVVLEYGADMDLLD
jgi:adenosine deaminase CECR1